jgi:putative phosphoribosyl transferase
MLIPAVSKLKLPECIIALPRGGAEVAYPIAQWLKLPVFLHYCRKLRSPSNPELAFGAIDQFGKVALNQDLIQELGISQSYIEQEIQYQQEDIKKRILKYGAETTGIEGKHCLLIDDGIATGYTMLSACQSLLAQNAKVTVVVPVTSASAYQKIQQQCNIIYLINDPNLSAIGQYYKDFPQTSDQSVHQIILETHHNN